eukprot:55507-Eustigmatos_ZCMA.PRE.1
MIEIRSHKRARHLWSYLTALGFLVRTDSFIWPPVRPLLSPVGRGDVGNIPRPAGAGTSSGTDMAPSSTSRVEAMRDRLAQEWELDCYSRPVVGDDGKKLWELLICDSLGDYRRVETMPSNMVNSRELRKLVEK